MIFEKLELKIKKLFKKKDVTKNKYQKLINKIKNKIEKLDGNTDKNSLEEIFIYKKILSKLEKKFH